MREIRAEWEERTRAEKPSSAATILRRHAGIAIDSNVLIYLLEGNGDRADRAATFVDAIGRGEVEGVMSSLAIAEILVPAARRGDGVGFEQTRGDHP